MGWLKATHACLVAAILTTATAQTNKPKYQGKNVTIAADVQMGTGVMLYDNVVIQAGVILGDNVMIKNNSVVGASSELDSQVVVDVNVQLGTGVILSSRVFVGNFTKIGNEAQIENGTNIWNGVQIGHNAFIDKSCVIGPSSVIGENATVGPFSKVGFPNPAKPPLKTTVGTNAQVGTNSTISAGVLVSPSADIRDNTIIGALATVGEEALIDKGTRVAPSSVIGVNATIGTNCKIGDVFSNRTGVKTTIEYGATVASGTNVGAGAYVGQQATIGALSTIGSLVRLASRITVSPGVVIGNGSMVNASSIGENSVLAPNVTLGAGSQLGSNVKVGTRAILQANASILNDVTIGNLTNIGPSSRIEGPATIGSSVIAGKNVTMGKNVTVESGVKFGNNVVVYPNTVVTKDGNWSVPGSAPGNGTPATNGSYPDNSAIGTDPFYVEPSASKTPIIIGVVVGVVVLGILILGGVWYYFRTHGPKEKPLKPLPEGFTEDVYENAADDDQALVRDQVQRLEGNIPHDIFFKQECIGQGAFGKVYKGVLYVDKKFSAIAIKELQDLQGDSAKELLAEANLMRKLIHPNIVSCIGISEEAEDEPLCIILEFMAVGDLREVLQKKEEQQVSISLAERLWYCYQMARGMAYLERMGIIHRDLAARNCMLGVPTPNSFGFNVLKVSDFGLSRQTSDDKNYYTMHNPGKIPARWLPPESYRKFKFSHKSDVWSYGVTVWEVFTNGDIPYKNQNIYNVLNKIEKDGYRLDQPYESTDEVYEELMMKTWAALPENRPTFAQLSRAAAGLFAVECAVPVVVETAPDGDVYLTSKASKLEPSKVQGGVPSSADVLVGDPQYAMVTDRDEPSSHKYENVGPNGKAPCPIHGHNSYHVVSDRKPAEPEPEEEDDGYRTVMDYKQAQAAKKAKAVADDSEYRTVTDVRNSKPQPAAAAQDDDGYRSVMDYREHRAAPAAEEKPPQLPAEDDGYRSIMDYRAAKAEREEAATTDNLMKKGGDAEYANLPGKESV